MNDIPVRRLEQFFDSLRTSNPFEVNRVDGSAPALADVPAVHEAAFKKLLSLVRHTHKENFGIGVILYGEAGIGKSHLLARLENWARANGEIPFVYLHNPQVTPRRLARYVLQCVFSALTLGRQDRFHGTPLYRLVKATRTEIKRRGGGNFRSLEENEVGIDLLVEGLRREQPARALLIDRVLWKVLMRFYLAANIAHYKGQEHGLDVLAVRWLSGDALEPDEARYLGLRPPGQGPVQLDDDQQIKQVLYTLAQMSWFAGKPIILGFDQVDNLDPDQLTALTRLVHALLDGVGNLLVVCSGVRQALWRYKDEGVIPQAAWDRLAKYEVHLKRLTKESGRRILEVRLHRFLEPFRDLPEVREHLGWDALFPLGTAWADGKLARVQNVRPRDVLSWAHERWSQHQDYLLDHAGQEWLARWTPGSFHAPPEADPAGAQGLPFVLDQRLAQEWNRQKALRLDKPHALPPSGDHLRELLFTLLQQVMRGKDNGGLTAVLRLEKPKKGPPPAYDLLVNRQDPQGRRDNAGLLFLTTGNPTLTAEALDRLLREKKPPRQLVLVTDERQPLPLAQDGAAEARRLFAELQESDRLAFRYAVLTFAQYAELDALVALAGHARSGDLEMEWPAGQVRAVSEQEVLESNQRQGRYRQAAVLKEVMLPGVREERV